ncbi:MAG TPA: hypothetical protein VLA32_10915 [Anaerolineales bacterium]|jgi:anaerobic ribonucleoside-triphosphate reductase|nr:hypothetical protein [Anaerolineales bacterium]
MQQLALKPRYSDIITGLEEYEGNLQALTRTRARIAYGDAGSENSLNNRIQEQLQIHAQLLNQLCEQTQENHRGLRKVPESRMMPAQAARVNSKRRIPHSLSGRLPAAPSGPT